LTRPAGAEILTLFGSDEALQPQLIPVEINLEGFPLFSRQKTPEGNALEVRQSISTDNGQRLNQLWRVTSSADFSLPGTYDEDVFVGVMALVKRRGGMPKDGKIRFSTYELLQALGKSKKGTAYKKLRQSLDRIASTIYYSENAFFNVEDESLETYRFTLWTIHFSRARGSDGRAAEHHTLKFDDIIIRSYNAGYLKLLDTDLYFALKIPLAKALYRLLDQRRRESMGWSVNVRELRDLLAMSKSYGATSRIWEVLAPAHRALKREKYLQSAVLEGDTARYKIHPDFARDWFPQEELTASLREQAITALVDKNVWPDRARKLVDHYGPEKAFHVLDVLSVRGNLEAKSKPGAYIAQVVENGDAGELAEMARFVASRTAGGDSSPEDAAAGRLSGGENPTLEQDSDSIGDLEDQTPLEPRFELDPAAQDLFTEVLADLSGEGEGEIDETSLSVWFDETFPAALDDQHLTILVPNTFAQDYIRTRFKTKVEASLKRLRGHDMELTVEVNQTTHNTHR